MSSVTVRPATEKDAAALCALYAPYVRDTAITFELEVPTVDEFAARIAHTLQRYPYLVAEIGGAPVGYAYAGPFKGRAAYDWSCETSIYLACDYRHEGIGSMLYDALESELVKMGMLNLYACIAYPVVEDEHLSLDSVRFHEHRGFSLVGRFHACGYKFDTWYDMVWMEKLVGDHVAHQPSVLWPK